MGSHVKSRTNNQIIITGQGFLVETNKSKGGIIRREGDNVGKEVESCGLDLAILAN